MEKSIQQLLKDTFSHFGKGEFNQALALAEEAHSINFESSEVIDSLKCAVFWKEKLERLESVYDSRNKGEYLFREFSGFSNRFVERLNSSFEEGLFQIRQFVFKQGIKFFQEAAEQQEDKNPELALLIGRGYKGLGDYDQALSYLEKAHQMAKDDSEVLGEMADCYDMIGDTRIAKLFFREAFYINPKKVGLEYIESKILKKIVSALEEKFQSSELIKEWIPVYGVLYGVFNVKRELRPLEVGTLKQSIYALKNELQETKGKGGILLPRLLNRYFWLIDHYLMIKEDRSKIEEILLNIRVIDPEIYELYTR